MNIASIKEHILLHDFSKWMIRGIVDKVQKKMEPVIIYKKENGWIKEHVAALEEGWNWVIELDEHPVNNKIGGFTGGPDDKNRKFFTNLRDIVLVHLDEDSHYDMRFLMMLKWVHEHWDRFEQSAETSYQIMNFHNLYAELLEGSKPLPVDDGTDEYSPEKIDYIAMEKKLREDKNGME